jgi:hypothetical protein
MKIPRAWVRCMFCEKRPLPENNIYFKNEKIMRHKNGCGRG